MGAIASGGVRVLNQDVIARANIGDEKVEQVAQQEKEELERREQAYRGDRERLDLENKIVILVDDGLATGASMRAAVEAVKTVQPKKVVVAVPTASAEACGDLKGRVDDAVCAQTPSPFFGVGAWYEEFSQVNDQQVRQILEDSRQS
jgi:predicted phosphoribosyltransferase